MTMPHLPELPTQLVMGHFPSLRALLGYAVGSLGKGKRRLAMEALDKFDDEAGRAMRQADKAIAQVQRAHQKVETAQTKVVSIISKLLVFYCQT